MILKINADTFGIISGSLCLVHCVATPFLFIARACTDTCCSSTPVWWQLVDYLLSYPLRPFTMPQKTPIKNGCKLHCGLVGRYYYLLY